MTQSRTLPGRNHATPPISLSLSTPEMEVLRLMTKGLFDREIAAELNLSPRRVSACVERLILKLNARSRTETAVMAIKFKLVP